RRCYFSSKPGRGSMLGETRGGGPVWDVESGGTVCVLVADCQRPQSRARPRTTFLTIRPQYESVPLPLQNRQPLTTPRTNHQPAPHQQAPAILQPDFNARVPGRLRRRLSQLYFQEFHSGVFAQPFLPRKEVWST